MQSVLDQMKVERDMRERMQQEANENMKTKRALDEELKVLTSGADSFKAILFKNLVPFFSLVFLC